MILFSLGPFCSQKACLTSELIYLAQVLSSPQTPYQALNHESLGIKMTHRIQTFAHFRIKSFRLMKLR